MTDTYGELFGDTYGAGVVVAGGGTTGIRVQVDWDRDGTWDTYGDDVSDRVRPRAAPVTATYGRDQSTAITPTVAGQGGFTLDNLDGRFSPRNPTSLLYGKMKPGRPVRIARLIDGATYVLFVGHTDDSPINPELSARTVSLNLVDSLADFRGQNLSTQVYRGIRSGEAIGYILDHCGWPAAKRDIDPGVSVFPWWWEDGTDALTALDKVVRSEGPPALLTMTADGSVQFRDRHHRLLDAASLTAQQTWWDQGHGYVMAKGFSYDEAWSKIINTGTASVDVRTPALEQVVWTSDATISVSEGEAKLVTASGSDPFYDAIVPEAGVDYTAVSGSVSIDLLRTSGSAVTIRINALATDAIITGLQLRARPVPTAFAVQVSVSDQVSIDEYGSRAFPADLPWCNQYDAEAILATAVATRANPLPVVQARFIIGTDTAKYPLLDRDLSDRVRVVERETFTDADFYIESITHTLTNARDHEVTFGLEEAAGEPDNVVRIGFAGSGVGQGVLGAGLDDPAKVIIIGSTVSGHRVGEGTTSS